MTDSPPLIAGVELGGTKVMALMARDRRILRSARWPTLAPGATLLAASGALAAWSAELGRPAALGLASFGPLHLHPDGARFGAMARTPKPGWSNIDVLGHFARRFAVPIGFDTDVAAAALAEARWGAARGRDVVVYVTVGTGVGGGVLAGGDPVHGRVHPEIGHLRVRRAPGDDFPGVCPFHADCLEGLASGHAIAARAGAPAESLGADHPVWRIVAHALGEMSALLILTLSPQRILIGGGVMTGRSFLFPFIRAAAIDALAGYVAGLTPGSVGRIIRSPALGEKAGPLGAIALGLRARTDATHGACG